MLYDIQAVRFIKTTSEMPVNKNTNADYICLGHFDMMHISKLGELTDKPLLEIQHDRDNVGESGFGCAENYVYSLYLLKRISSADEELLNTFWKGKEIYTVVTRIHCDYPSEWNKEKLPFSKIIEEYCIAQTQESARVFYQDLGNGQNSCVVTFSSCGNQAGSCKTDVRCVFYDSLELGDTVSIMKSNSITAILEVVRCLSANKCVRDTYTYCGIDRKLIQNVALDVTSCVPKDAELAHISTRFSVRDIKNANVFFRELKKDVDDESPQFYVTGTADRTIHWSVCKETQLIQIVRALTKQSGDMHWCFDDVITRIGINQEIDGNVNDKIIKKGKPSIKVLIPRFYDTMNWLRDDLTDSKVISWKYTLLKLLGTLETMYTNYVMDDLANLIIPSVGAFLERLNYLRDENDGSIPDECDDDIIQFLNCWTSLTNDISQLESQLTQHPELSPVRYYIPAMVLQFELRFVEFCCKALSIEKSRSFVPMLVPVDTPDLNTLCPLDPRQQKYNKSCPLLVFIPFKDLYRPWETAFRIAHEMAHYCEDPSRERIERHHALLKCAAVYIAKYWYRMYVKNSTVYKNDNLYKKTLEYADILFKTFGENIDLDYPDEPWYLSQSEAVILREASKAILSDRYLEQYLYSTNSDYFFKKQKDYSLIQRKVRRPSESLVQQDNFEHHLELLTFLCGECYADIAMGLLTDCTFEDYYTSVYQDEFLRFTERCDDVDELIAEPFVMRQIVRMALVIQAIGQIKGRNSTWGVANITTKQANEYPLVNCAVEIIKESSGCNNSSFLSRSEVDMPDFASVEDFCILKAYLVKCAQKLEDKLNDTNSDRYKFAQAVRNGISYVKDSEFDWTKVQKYILG